MARRADSRIFFPWESRGGIVRRLRLGRVRPLVIGALVAGVILAIGVRERDRAGVRQTRAKLTVVRAALDRYLTEHEGGCPETIAALVGGGTLTALPTDAWGRAYRLTCPGRLDGARYDLMSDGPDGLPGGLDRIE